MRKNSSSERYLQVISLTTPPADGLYSPPLNLGVRLKNFKKVLKFFVKTILNFSERGDKNET